MGAETLIKDLGFPPEVLETIVGIVRFPGETELATAQNLYDIYVKIGGVGLMNRSRTMMPRHLKLIRSKLHQHNFKL